MDVAHARSAGRLAWCISWGALLPAQDEEDGVSNPILGYCLGLAGGPVDVLVWRSEQGYLVIVGGFCYGYSNGFCQRRASSFVTRKRSGRHSISSVSCCNPSVAGRGTSLKVLTRASALFEYAWAASRFELALICKAFHPRTTATGTLATCEGACQIVCSLACDFAKGVLGCAASNFAHALLQLERVGLVGGGDLVDLV